MAVQDTTSPSIVQIRNTGGVLFTFGVLTALLYFGRLFIVTLLLSIFIAFILEPIVNLFMRMRLPRGFASFLVCSLALVVIYAGALLAYSQAAGIWEELPAYSQRISQITEKVLVEVEGAEKAVNDLLTPRRIRDQQRYAQQQAEAQKQPSALRRRRAADPPMAPLLPPPVQEVRIRADRSPVMEYLYENWHQFYDILLMSSFVPF